MFTALLLQSPDNPFKATGLQLHYAPAGEGSILCGSCVRLSTSPVSPSVLTTYSTPLPSVAGHPIATRLGAG